MNPQRMYLFNPDHDLALANGDENFNAPELARGFMNDLSVLPLWYAKPGSIVVSERVDEEWLNEIKRINPRLSSISVEKMENLSGIEENNPWGWNPSIRKKLKMKGASPELLPTEEQIASIRRLSHRETAIEAMEFLRGDKDIAAMIPDPAIQLGEKDIDRFLEKYPYAVLKAPLSGSGKGLFWINGTLTTNARGWCRRTIEKQGCIIGEQVYDKVIDFAIEGECRNGKAKWIGYSLFNTDRQGIYNGNILMEDEKIIGLIESSIPRKMMERILQRLILFIERTIAPLYSGVFGIDMMVYQSGGNFMLHPCVEINLRMTMGIVAHELYKNFIGQGSTGTMSVEYFPSSEKLYQDHTASKSATPTTTEEGLITGGYLTLAPVGKTTHYRIKAVINKL